jgi:methionyl-tRNA synthetase
MEKKGPYYLTTAIAYTSGRPTYWKIPMKSSYPMRLHDIKRAEGYDVYFSNRY